MLVRERPPLRHTLNIETPTGRRYRWAPDEHDASNVFDGLRWASTMPGGFSDGDCVLARKPGTEYADLARLSTVRIESAGGERVGEYRLERTPRVSGDRMSVSPGLVGWQAHLEDDKSAAMIYVSRGLSRWGPPGTSRLGQLYAANIRVGETSVNSDRENARPAIVQTINDSWEAPYLPAVESWYDAGPGLRIARIYWSLQTKNADDGGTAWADLVLLSPNDAPTSGTESSANVNAGSGAAAVTGALDATTAMRYAFLSHGYAITPAGAQGFSGVAEWSDVAVYGDHGLARYGTEPAGVIASDVVAHAVGRWAPLLNFTTGSEGTIRPSSFVIADLAFHDPGPVGEIVRQATRFGLEDWGVWDDQTLYWNARGERGRSWRARVGPAQLEETGPQVERLWESIIVAYRDVDGSTRTVGPPGSGADTETSDLKDSDPENPANQLGINRRDLLQMGTGTAAGASEIGRRFLEQTKLLDSSGRARLVGHVEDNRGVLHPYSHVRGGDTITFVDAHDTQARRIVKADHSYDEHACSIDLDAPPDGLQAVLERLDVSLIPLGIG